MIAVMLRNSGADPTAPNASELTTKDCAYFFCEYAEVLGRENGVALEFYSEDIKCHGQIVAELDGGELTYLVNGNRYDFCFIEPQSHSLRYPKGLRIPPPA